MQIISGESFAEQISAWGVPCSFCDLKLAPQLVKYNFIMKNLLQLAKVKKMADNLTAWSGLATQIETNCGGFSIVQPRLQRANTTLDSFADTLSASLPCTMALGTDTNGNQIVANLDDAVHLLVGGSTGSGKSVLLNNMILSLACYNEPSDLQIVLIDPKIVSFTQFRNLSHLRYNVITDTQTANLALDDLIREMNSRYSVMAGLGIDKNTGEFPKIVVFIDEISDLVLASNEIKDKLVVLLQKSRACGIHFVCCCQSPRSSVLSGLLLANLPTRICLTCASYRESMLILNHGGGEKLTGKGDCIIKLPNSINEMRVQVPYISPERIKELLY